MKSCEYIRLKKNLYERFKIGSLSKDLLRKHTKHIWVYSNMFLKEISITISRIPRIQRNDIKEYLQHKIQNGLSVSRYKQLTWVLKLFFSRFLGRQDIIWDEMYPEKWETKLPNILSKSEVKTLLDNIKHKIFLYWYMPHEWGFLNA